MSTDIRAGEATDRRNARSLLEFGPAFAIVRAMQGAFDGPNRKFWIYQCSLWGAYLAMRLVLGFMEGVFIPAMWARLAGTAGGFLTTYVMWRILRRQTAGGVWRQIWYIVIMAIVGATLAHQIHFSILYFKPYEPLLEKIDKIGFWPEYLKMFSLLFYREVWVLVAWGGLYLGIDYYGRFQEEKLRAVEASSLAQQSQIRMLRYQLNPHFMFNTLNALSALVLTKSTDRAERMIIGLSRLLRYSLDSDPLAKVPLDQELEALSLYVGIERERFGDRLTFEEDIEPDTRSCLVPSLVLQPLVENALKYAIAPSRKGGTIRLTAALRGGQLKLGVSDTGPGLSRPVKDILGQPGIGLSNTITRLERIYGASAHMKIENLEPKGLAVTIVMPEERRRPERKSGES